MNAKIERDDDEESAIKTKVAEFACKKITASGLVIPDFITYRTMLEYEKLRKEGAYNMLDYSAVKMQASIHQFYSIVCLLSSEYLFLLRNYSELMKHYEIARN